MDIPVVKWAYAPAHMDVNLAAMLASLSEIFALEVNPANPRKLHFKHIEAAESISEVEFVSPDEAVISYSNLSAAARGVGSVLSGISGRQSTPFSMLGIMLDLSRNQVFTVEAMIRIFRRLALLGFNTVLLYCEDTYELPGEPAFGVMRGRYTAAEIRAMDDAAAELGIELIGCIQTLGHMQQILRWRYTYSKITDTESVMRVDASETHELIGKMLDFWSTNLRSRRIHVGMDETHDLGRGKFLDENGYKAGFALFTEQLNLVSQACAQRGLQPMIWSDMFFRLGNPQQNYYDLNSNIPQEVREAIPDNVRLVYWDYYTMDQNFYENFIEMHRELGGEPLMGAGIWIWSRLWYDHVLSGKANRSCINGCRQRQLKEIFFTMWGDDGAICHWDSAWTGLTEASDLAFGIDDETVTARRYRALTGSDYQLNRLPGLLHRETALTDPASPVPRWHYNDMAIFWDDLLLALGYRNLQVIDPDLVDSLIAEYTSISEKLSAYRHECGGGDLNYGWLLVRFLRDKLAARKELERAYRFGDRAALKVLAEETFPALAELFEEITVEFRKQWLRNSKVFGLETMQHRMGGQLQRIREASLRLSEYLSGVYEHLEELEEPLLEEVERMVLYRDMASGSVHV